MLLPPLHFEDGEPEAPRKSPYVGKPRSQTQRVSGPKVCTSAPHDTTAHRDSNMHTFCVILDDLQESFYSPRRSTGLRRTRNQE